MSDSRAAWIVVLDEERDIDLRSRVCFPRRICIATGNPASCITKEYQLRIASCAVNIGGQLYVLTAGAEGPEETWGGSRPGRSEPRLNIKQFLRLGHVVNHPRATKFTLIKVDGAFETCRDQSCSKCSTPINNFWATGRVEQHGYEQVRLTTLKKGHRASGRQDVVSKHVINLQYPAGNINSSTFADYNRHEGETVESGLRERLSLTDSGSLVSHDGQDIGISIRIMPGVRVAGVLLFDDKLWAYLASILQVSGGPANTWKHLDRPGRHEVNVPLRSR
ncbi:hypothetical protein F4801DRAFT_601884 [Xylaria longipes]|nr:hypothetical protein F4801DRAFT_601884 [Xylaria longipes]RYC55908.1 hypothetical protein CHU98_g10302 [Xylaria longipes]